MGCTRATCSPKDLGAHLMRDERFVQIIILPEVETECICILWADFNSVKHAFDIALNSDSFLAETKKYSKKGVGQVWAS